MCGRTVCTNGSDSIARRCRYRNQQGQTTQPRWKDAPGGQQYRQSYNIAPGAYTPVLYETNDNTDTQRTLQPMLWGLIPKWHKGSAGDFGYKMNNCRSESMTTTMSYKTPLSRGQRCVIIADGFYEWKKESTGKQPYYMYISPKDQTSLQTDTYDESQEDEFHDDGKQLMKMAGLYDIWLSPEGEKIYSYSVITVESSSTLSFIHHRMPAILLTDREINTWLDPSVPVNKATSVIRSITDISYHPVSSAVNNSRYSSPDCIVKIDPRKSTPNKPSAGANFMKNWLKSGKTTQKVTPNNKLSPENRENIPSAVKRPMEHDDKSCSKAMKHNPC